jgi:DNA invertase Pin-like site-specific DNA recombinase
MGKSVAIYVRVSKTTGDVASQLPELERWAKGQDNPVVWYTDKFTGETMTRPEWSRLEADVKAGKVGSVVVWRLDRLGRTAKGLTALFDDLNAKRVNLVSLKDGLDLKTPAGRLMANVLASVAQYETEVRAERVQAGLEVAKAKGVKLGRRPTPDWERAKRISVTPDQEAQIKRLTEAGEKKARIARATGVSRQTVYDVLGRCD